MKKQLLIALLVMFTFSACQKDEELTWDGHLIGLGGEEMIQNDTDKWIYDNFTKPYNIEIKYRWDQSELDLNRTLVPVDEDKVIPLLKSIKKIWIAPYEQVAGRTFVRRICPKKFVLVGSPKYNNNTITLGEAEGGRKIVMYRLNWFDPTNGNIVREILKTVHHEFGHTMHQTILYPLEFKTITPAGYTAAWNNVSEAVALKLGYVSSYASAAPDEDFVENIARNLVYGSEWFAKKVADAAAVYADPAQNVGMEYNPAEAMIRKMNIVTTYLKEVWGINFYDPSPAEKGLQTLVQEAIAEVTAGNLE